MALALAWLTVNPASAQRAIVSVVPDADTFVRSFTPTNNYGGGGALSVSGSASVNGSLEQNGLFDTLMRFPASNVVASLNDTLGATDWIVTDLRLVLNEMAAPDNAIFNRGVGAFEVRWIAEDNWLEGTGRPNPPTTDGVTWQDLPSILNPSLDQSLGVFTNRGVDGQAGFPLALAEQLISDLRQAGEISLYLTAHSPDIGFTFNSRNFGNTNLQPSFVITAAGNPRPEIKEIALVGTNVVLRFGIQSNWACRLQGAPSLSAPVAWSDLLTILPQPAATNIVFVDSPTNDRRFYRLRFSP